MKKLRKKKASPVADPSVLVKEQAARIAELKQENASLVKRLDEYVAREKELADTIAFAKKKCDEWVSNAKIKYALECERLKTFRAKWLSAAKDGYLKYGVEKTDQILQECRAELEKAFADDLGVTDYLFERDRISAEPTLDYRAIISDEVKKSPSTSDQRRKIEELSESDLAELLKQL
ncbi:MAG: hypothetical protein IJ735_03290 [Clostridia bacterium]|nr:hypothetical protein [Clostridia bacterium]